MWHCVCVCVCVCVCMYVCVYKFAATEPQSPRRRRRPLSAHAEHLSNHVTPRVVHSASSATASPPPTRSAVQSVSAGVQLSTEDLARSPSTTVTTALERFRSLETLPTTSNTTSARRGASRPTTSGRIPPTGRHGPALTDSRQAATRPGAVDQHTTSDTVYF